MIIKLFETEGFSEWVSQVLLFIDFLKLNITSIHDLSDQVVAAQYMLGALIGLWFLHLNNGVNAVVVQQDRTIDGGCHSKLVDELL